MRTLSFPESTPTIQPSLLRRGGATLIDALVIFSTLLVSGAFLLVHQDTLAIVWLLIALLYDLIGGTSLTGYQTIGRMLCQLALTPTKRHAFKVTARAMIKWSPILIALSLISFYNSRIETQPEGPLLWGTAIVASLLMTQLSFPFLTTQRLSLHAYLSGIHTIQIK